jgi:serine/threonine-protein kinase
MVGRIILGRYEITEPLARGSMGQVWLARDRAADRQAVVKVMHPDVAARPKFRDFFRREMQLMAAFRHPHAVELYAAVPDGSPCLVMEYVPGLALDAVLEKRRLLLPDEVGDVLAPVCQALAAAHASGIVHRDLKPANVMVADARRPGDGVKLMDLGLAAAVTRPYVPLEKLRGSDELYATGTPAYVCPEQLRGDQADNRGDIYSLGVMLFELLTGRLPFDDAVMPAVLHAHVHQPPPTFRQVGLGILPVAVERVVHRCLAKYPNERPQSAYEVACLFSAAINRDPKLDRKAFEPLPAAVDEKAFPQAEVRRPGQSPQGVPTPGGVPKPNPNDPEQVVERLEAWMPEAIAAVKLRGFVDGYGGTVLASQPGLILVRFDPPPAPRPKSGMLGWLAAPAPPAPRIAPIALDLHLGRGADTAGGRSQVALTAVFRAPEGRLPTDPLWHRKCHALWSKLRGHLMA